MSDALAASYRACRRVVRASGSNFALAFWLLPREKRLAMDALYAFARAADDLGDGEGAVAHRRAALERFQELLHRALSGAPEGGIWPAVADMAQRFGLPSALLDDVIRGVQSDLEITRYATWEDLQRYCYHVAGAVGIACLHLWGFRGSRPLALAETCGQAFQLTNILRDLKEDAQRDRIYLPQQDLDACGYSAEELRRGVANAGFDRLMELQLLRAEALYAAAAAMHDDLSVDGQRVFRLMFGRYQAILAAIKRQPRVVLQRRISLTLPHKLWIAGRQLASPTAVGT